MSTIINGETFSKIQNYLGNFSLWDDINSYGVNSPHSSLYPPVGNDPDGVFSKVPYEKGNQFMYFLELTMGDEEMFRQFLAHFIGKYKY